MAPRKAPGIDGLTVEMLRAINDKSPQFLEALLNKCLSLGCFPESWKYAKLVLLAKPSKDPRLPGSYRPICLLSVVSKVLDKLITQRLLFLCQQQDFLHPRQHGFRAGRSCETASASLWSEMFSALGNRGRVCIVSLDVAGAFDSVWRHSVLKRLIQANCPRNIFGIVRDYFQNRQVVYFHASGSWHFLAERGVPQGSCSSPFYWNLVHDMALDVGLPEGCFLQAFADDLVLVIKGRTKEEIEEKGTLALAILIQWGRGHKLLFNETKTVVLPITFGGHLSLLDPIRITMNSTVLTVSDGCRYLGVWWNSGLTSTEHFKRVRRRVDLLSYRLSMVAGRFFSRRVGTFFRLYKGPLEPFALYGHGAWGNRLALKKLRDLLCSIQRRPLLKLTQAYRTTSTEALQVLAGVLPLDLKAELVFTKFKIFTLRVNGQVGLRVIRSQDYRKKVDKYEVHPLYWRPIHFGTKPPTGFEMELFTGGSRLNGKVGSSAVVLYNGCPIQTVQCRLPDHASVFDAEVGGMNMALTLIQGMAEWHPIRIYTDSLSLLKALEATISVNPAVWDLKRRCLDLLEVRRVEFFWVKAHVGVAGNELADKHAKLATAHQSVDMEVLKSVSTFHREIMSDLQYIWQDRWILSEKGRQTAQFFPLVDLEQKFYNHRITQIITGHGRFPFYFKRFGISDNDMCACGRVGDANHYLMECPRTGDLRAKLRLDLSYLPSLLEQKCNLAPLEEIMKRVLEFVPNL
ncbi:Putative protein in type-1 retrotransposable element R1DM [Araneus ventricosus]|uniref:Retrovirus-related Pol polyprotein from type-1 retrotransposable element R1 n=1 Tax=Araneus ventricosus TaxID=182803 RepID=A0A4Y2NHX3_ARAVE|nr:Putative protein in type-1 retrotransposable element R1DM [Araneus ventricosus]